MRLHNDFYLIAVGVCMMMMGIVEFVVSIYMESWQGIVFSLLFTALGTDLVVTTQR